ncbi:hypothetical protein L7F22_045896 [Adiantum nelumboides]|nr:hypothetical protein [Adiantum nelumboides]
MGQGQAEGKIDKKGDNRVVVRVDMDCEACKQKVKKVLKNFPGVENIDLNSDEQKVTIKGNVDAWKVFEALRSKCGRRTMLVYPQLSKDEERKAKEDSIINSVNKIVDSITELFTPKPPNTVVELKVRMHCGACAKKVKKILLRLDGVMDVEGDMAMDKVVVKGRDLDAEMLCETVKHSGKPCELISYKKEEIPLEKKKKGEKKEDNKADKKEETLEKSEGKEEKAQGNEEKKDQKQGKKKGSKKGEKEVNKSEKEEGTKGVLKGGESKEGDEGEKKGDQEADKGENKKEKQEEKKGENKPAKSTQEGKNGIKGERKEVKPQENKETKSDKNEGDLEDLEAKKFVYIPYQSVPEYVYPPQIFSDENPNACSLM